MWELIPTVNGQPTTWESASWEGKRTTRTKGYYRVTIPKRIAEIAGIYGKTGNYALMALIHERLFLILLTQEDIAKIFLHEDIENIEAMAIRRVNVNRYIRYSIEPSEDEKLKLQALGKNWQKKTRIEYISQAEAINREYEKQYWIYIPPHIMGVWELGKKYTGSPLRVDFIPHTEKIYLLQESHSTGHIVGNYYMRDRSSENYFYAPIEEENFRLTIPKHICRKLEEKEGEIRYTILYVKNSQLYLRILTDSDLWQLFDDLP